jgi:hypothetical protein
MACEACITQKIPGILVADHDDREESTEGRVWIARCDDCAFFGSDVEAAEYLAMVSGWPLMKSYDSSDSLDDHERQMAVGKDWWRPYFDKKVSEVEFFLYGPLPPAKERAA